MKINLFVTLLTIILGAAVTGQAQSYRLTDLSNRLSTQSENLAERAYNNYAASNNNNRTDFDNMMLAQQLSATANTFRRMVQDRRRNSELQDAAELLSDLSRRFPSYGEASLSWRDARRAIDEVSRELQIDNNGSGGSPINNNDEPRNKDLIGQVRWRGTVDDEVQLHISGTALDAKTISGTAFQNGDFNFTSPLPSNRRSTIEVTKIKGRGNVRVIQQPNRDNNFTAVVQIKDSGNGAKEYELEIYWTR